MSIIAKPKIASETEEITAFTKTALRKRDFAVNGVGSCNRVLQTPLLHSGVCEDSCISSRIDEEMVLAFIHITCSDSLSDNSALCILYGM